MEKKRCLICWWIVTLLSVKTSHKSHFYWSFLSSHVVFGPCVLYEAGRATDSRPSKSMDCYIFWRKLVVIGCNNIQFDSETLMFSSTNTYTIVGYTLSVLLGELQLPSQLNKGSRRSACPDWEALLLLNLGDRVHHLYTKGCKRCFAPSLTWSEVVPRCSHSWSNIGSFLPLASYLMYFWFGRIFGHNHPIDR